MTTYKVGDVVSVEFPFSDFQTTKRRPGLVLAVGEDFLLARLTTHLPRESSDIFLQRWSDVGLPRASTVRLMKLVTIDQRLVHHRIGHLHPDDINTIVQALHQMAADIAREFQTGKK